MARIDVHRGRQFVGRTVQQAMPLTPMGQLKMLLDIARLNNRSLSLIAVFQIAAQKLHLGGSNPKFLVRLGHLIVVGQPLDAALDDLAISQ